MPTPDTDTNLNEAVRRLIDGTLEGLRDPRGALIPILHSIQREFGYVPEAAIPIVADALNLTRAEAHGVVSFYHDFRSEKTGRHVVQICQAESCQALGSAAVTAAARTHLDIDFEETTPDGGFTLRKVFCLGNCARSPNIMIDSEVHGRVTPEAVGTLIDASKGGA